MNCPFNLLKCCLLSGISLPNKLRHGTGQQPKVENKAPTTRSCASYVKLTSFLSLDFRQVVMAVDRSSWGHTCLWARRFPRHWLPPPRPITHFLGVGRESCLGDSRTTVTICRPCYQLSATMMRSSMSAEENTLLWSYFSRDRGPPLQLGSLSSGVVHQDWIIKQLLVSGSRRCAEDMSVQRKTHLQPLSDTDE